MNITNQNYYDNRNYLKLVKNEYSDAEVVDFYTTVGLFPAEKIINETYFKPGTKLLYFGCGAGRTSLALAQIGFDLVAIDLVPEIINPAPGKAGICRADGWAHTWLTVKIKSTIPATNRFRILPIPFT